MNTPLEIFIELDVLETQSVCVLNEKEEHVISRDILHEAWHGETLFPLFPLELSRDVAKKHLTPLIPRLNCQENMDIWGQGQSAPRLV